VVSPGKLEVIQSGDHLSSESVSVTPSIVIEASIVLCSVFMTRVSQCPISLRSEHPIRLRLPGGLFPSGRHVVIQLTNLHVAWHEHRALDATSKYIIFSTENCVVRHQVHAKYKALTNIRFTQLEMLYTRADHNKHINKLCAIFLTIS
jgi:hypothetical protein